MTGTPLIRIFGPPCAAALCNNQIPASRRADAIYCSDRCSNRMKVRRRRARLLRIEMINNKIGQSA